MLTTVIDMIGDKPCAERGQALGGGKRWVCSRVLDVATKEGEAARMAGLVIGGCHGATVERDQAWALCAVWRPPVLHHDPVCARLYTLGRPTVVAARAGRLLSGSHVLTCPSILLECSFSHSFHLDSVIMIKSGH